MDENGYSPYFQLGKAQYFKPVHRPLKFRDSPFVTASFSNSVESQHTTLKELDLDPLFQGDSHVLKYRLAKLTFMSWKQDE